MLTPRFLAISAVFAALALSACDNPKPRGPAAAPAAEAMPALPAWSAEMLGKPVTALFPGEIGVCVGNTDNLAARYGGAPQGVKIIGWGWDPATKAPIGRILLVDAAGDVVGAGEPGLPRPDVPAAKPEITAPDTGWAAYTSRTAGPVDAYGIIADGKSACRLGHLVYP